MAKVEFNKDSNSIEIYFDNKPSDEDRELLMQNGFRWYSKKRCWYAINNEHSREITNSIFDKIDKFNEDTRELLEDDNEGLDYSVIVLQAGKHCELLLTELIKNKGIEVDANGVVVDTEQDEFKHYRNMSVLTYACKSLTLLPKEMRRIMQFIRNGRNAAAHSITLNKAQLTEFMKAFNAFTAWYYLESGTYKTEQNKRLLSYVKALDMPTTEKVNKENRVEEIAPEMIAALKKETISNAASSMDRLEQTITQIVRKEVQMGVSEVKGVVISEAGEIKEKIDELSEMIVGLSEKIGDYQSLVERQLSMAVSAEEEEIIIHAFSEECVSKMSDRFEKNTADKNYKRNLYDLKETLGEVCWERLDPRSRTFLISSRVMYDELIVLDDVIDYSGVCLLVTKALEYELSKRFYTKFLSYLKGKYGKNYSKYPSTMIRKYNGNVTTMQKHDFTLGAIAYIFCMKPFLKQGEDITQKNYDKNILLDFAMAELYENASRKDIETQLDAFAVDIEEIKNKYRNKAAHTNEIKKKNARECFDIVLDVQKLLKTMIEAFNKEK